MKKIYLASDHAGVEFKSFCGEYFKNNGYEVVDLGPETSDRVDYPDYAKKLCKKVLEDVGSEGCLICGTGIGMSMSANRFRGIRGALCHDAYTAGITKAHNNSNVLVMGARTTGLATAESIMDAWINNEFEGGRHEDRIKKIELD